MLEIKEKVRELTAQKKQQFSDASKVLLLATLGFIGIGTISAFEADVERVTLENAIQNNLYPAYVTTHERSSLTDILNSGEAALNSRSGTTEDPVNHVPDPIDALSAVASVHAIIGDDIAQAAKFTTVENHLIDTQEQIAIGTIVFDAPISPDANKRNNSIVADDLSDIEVLKSIVYYDLPVAPKTLTYNSQVRKINNRNLMSNLSFAGALITGVGGLIVSNEGKRVRDVFSGPNKR